jgi:hypothetical protein
MRLVFPDDRAARLSTPDTQARVVGYLATASVAAPGFHTDGVFVWPHALATAARHDQAPPFDLYVHMRQSSFLLPDALPPSALAQAAALVPPEPSPVDSPVAADQSAPIRRAACSSAPDRLRIPEPVRRKRLAAYLESGTLVLRAVGAGWLGWRTDGAWVWPEALSDDLCRRGVAPELALLCHIESQGYARPPVPAERALAAATVARERPAALPEPPSVRYLTDGAGGLLRVWSREPDTVEVLRADLRWGPPAEPLDEVARAMGFRPIGEDAAAALVDARWARGGAEPALD